MSPTSYQTAPPRGVLPTYQVHRPAKPGRYPPAMRLWRRSVPAVPEPPLPEPEPQQFLVAPRVERAVIALAFHAQQLDDRLGRLERRLDDAEESTDALPTHDDLLDVRLHSARVSAELTRVTVELRAEIERANRATRDALSA
jgi:hypothetical protein